jgi:hypothetical protein
LAWLQLPPFLEDGCAIKKEAFKRPMCRLEARHHARITRVASARHLARQNAACFASAGRMFPIKRSFERACYLWRSIRLCCYLTTPDVWVSSWLAVETAH